MTRWRLALGSLGVVAVLAGLGWLLAWLVLPHWVKGKFEERGTAWLGRPVRVAEVDVVPHRLLVTLHKITVAAAPGSGQREAQAAVNRLRADLSWRALWRGTPVLEALVLERPRMRATRLADGRYDVDDLIERLWPKEGEALPPFALYNVQLRDGEFRLDDKPAGRQHRLTKLELALPFLSNQESDLAVKVEPKLSFVLNGAPFDSGVSATPFGANRSANLRLKVQGYGLETLQAYLPKDVAVRPTRGKLDADLVLNFEQGAEGPQLVLAGELAARDVRFVQPGGEAVASWASLRASLKDVQPLARRAHLALLRVDGLDLELARDAGGRLNLVAAPPAAEAGAVVAGAPAASAASAAAAASAPAQAASASAPAAGWRVKLDALDLVKARVHWRDAAVTPAADVLLRSLDLKLDNPHWPLVQPMELHLLAEFATTGTDKPQPAGRLEAGGTVSHDSALLTLKADQLALDPAHPYLTPWFMPRAEGRLTTEARVEWAAEGEAARGRVKLPGLKLADFRLTEGTGGIRGPAAAWKALELGETEVDWVQRQVKLAKLSLTQPLLVLARGADGRLNLARWLPPPPKGEKAEKVEKATDKGAPKAAPKAASAAAGAASAPAEWKYALQDLKVDGGTLRWQDAAAGPRPAAFQLDNLKFAGQALQWPGDANAKPLPLQWSARMAPVPTKDAPPPRTGTLDWRGQWLWQPQPRAEGQLVVERAPVHLLAPYLGLPVLVDALRADGSFKGSLAWQPQGDGAGLQATGEATVADGQFGTRKAEGGHDELFAWQTLALQGLSFNADPKGPPRLEVAEAQLSDWRAVALLVEPGEWRVTQAPPPPAAAASAAAAAASGAASGAAPGAASGVPAASGAPAVAANPASAVVARSPTPAAPPWQVVWGRTRLAGGRLEWQDRHVKPATSVQASELAGSLGRWQWGAREPAALELKGRGAGNATLELAGSVLPWAPASALDLRLKFADWDLAPLSAYALKYAGHPIERGRAGGELHYRVSADGKLDAQQRVLLQQLVLGAKVAPLPPEATRQPVALGLALLKDRSGNLELNLPAAGALADPQFSLAATVGRQLNALVAKVAAAPLAQLGGDELAQAEFEPGTARLTERGRSALDRLAVVLQERPVLLLNLSGSADALAERSPVDAPGPRELALQRANAAREHLAGRGVAAERLVVSALRMRGAGPEDAQWTPRVYLTLTGP